MASDLIEFYGTECTHCNAMKPLIERLEDELGVKVDRIEVWHNEQNAKKLEEIDKGECGGVPFFYNAKTGQKVCGAMSYEKLKAWATGKK